MVRLSIRLRCKLRCRSRGGQTFHNLPFCEPRGADVRERPRERDEFRAALPELRAAATARWEAEARLAQLYRERTIARARAFERDPHAMLN